MVGMPHRYFKKLSLSGQLSFLTLPPPGRYGVGMIFLPNGEENETRRIELMDNIERVIRSYGLSVLGWRSPLPTKSSILGRKIIKRCWVLCCQGMYCFRTYRSCNGAFSGADFCLSTRGQSRRISIGTESK